MKRSILGLLACACVWLAFGVNAQKQKPSQHAGKQRYDEWRHFGGTPDNIHYSTLSQITKENVSQLAVAWEYDTGDVFNGSEMQCNPIMVDGLLYVTTPKLRTVALDAATGKEVWSFNPYEGQRAPGKQRNRGLMYWESGNDKRVYVSARHWFYALDAKTGKPIEGFGDKGRIDLREGLERDPAGISISVTTPGAVYRDLLIVGGLMSEALPAGPGHIRAFDARTGRQRWSFHTIPHPGEFGYETWPKEAYKYIGGANSWPGLVVDEKRGLVFVPTGSAAFDFYGSNRHGDNLFANTLLCLDAATGKRKWHFQTVKHDVWDRDFPAAPVLVTVKHRGRMVDAVAQITKDGHVWVFERETGKSLFPYQTVKVKTDGVAGERLAETQVLPLAPPPFARQRLTEDLLTRRTPEAHADALKRFRTYRSEGQFTPPSTQGTIIFPGYDGGGEWGGAAFDPETGWLYVNSNEMAWVLRMIERPKAKDLPSGKSVYLQHCASCHLENLQGTPPEFPSLIAIGKKYSDSELRGIIRNGLGRMPAFNKLSSAEMRALSLYLATGVDEKIGFDKEVIDSIEAEKNSPLYQSYTMDGYNKFLDKDGYPAIAPPWGTLNAIDLNAGKIIWQIPFGEFPELAAKGMSNTGSENYGGGIVTKSGLFFIGATNHDKKFRVYDKKSGKLLWETLLPAAGNATPAMYEASDRQFIVIACGGGKSGAPSGSKYVAFALPVKK